METIHAQKFGDPETLLYMRRGEHKKIQFKVGCVNLESFATLRKTQQTS